LQLPPEIDPEPTDLSVAIRPIAQSVTAAVTVATDTVVAGRCITLAPVRAKQLVEWSDELGAPVADEGPAGGGAIIELALARSRIHGGTCVYYTYLYTVAVMATPNGGS
jgi:hypothetical protein